MKPFSRRGLAVGLLVVVPLAAAAACGSSSPSSTASAKAKASVLKTNLAVTKAEAHAQTCLQQHSVFATHGPTTVVQCIETDIPKQNRHALNLCVMTAIANNSSTHAGRKALAAGTPIMACVTKYQAVK